jgi:hypothetical protein
MTKARYSEVRTKNTFLHEYFMEESGRRLDINQFEQMLDAWLMTHVMVHPMQGREIIVKYLDGIVRN